MFTGAITQYIDVAQLVLYVFWLFFVLLVVYLQAESRREGFPLERDPRLRDTPVPKAMPSPKTYHEFHGGTAIAPDVDRELGQERELAIEANANFLGAPFRPTGDPLVDGVGPASWVNRADEPDRDVEGGPRIQPLRTLGDGYSVASFSADPRGMAVRTFDGEIVGEVTDVFVDHMESLIRYLEVKRTGGDTVLLPMSFARVRKQRSAPTEGSLADRLVARRAKEIRVASVTAEQFARSPKHASPDQVTLREEDRIQGYFGGGAMYGTADRAEPFL